MPIDGDIVGIAAKIGDIAIDPFQCGNKIDDAMDGLPDVTPVDIVVNYNRCIDSEDEATLAVLTLALIGFVTGRPEFLDIAILYTLLNLIGTIAVLRYFHPSEN